MPHRYRTVVVDPPWDYGQKAAPWRSSTKAPYRLMSIEEIASLPVPELSTDTAHLYCWAVLPLMAEAYDVVRGWGFTPATLLTWCKAGPGLGGGFRGNTEHLIVARRGFPETTNPTCARCGGRVRGSRKCGCPDPAWRHKGKPVGELIRPFSDVAGGTWYEAPRGEHSAKPELFLDLAERMSPEPRVELFARRDRLGWETWGDESLGTAELPAPSTQGVAG